MKIIVGLGNPGTEYTNNRHNAGFQSLNYLAKAHGLSFGEKGSHARLARGRLGRHDVVLAKPQTFMNLSGKSVGALLLRYRLSPSDIIVIHDDVDLPLGRLRIRPGGGAGGHRGIESIIVTLRTPDFSRVRVGVGRPAEASDGLRDYVLGDFDQQDREVLKEVLPRVSDAVLCILEDGVEAAMNKYNS